MSKVAIGVDSSYQANKVVDYLIKSQLLVENTLPSVRLWKDSGFTDQNILITAEIKAELTEAFLKKFQKSIHKHASKYTTIIPILQK